MESQQLQIAPEKNEAIILNGSGRSKDMHFQIGYASIKKISTW